MVFLLAAALLAAAGYIGLQIYLRYTVERHLQAAVLATPALTDITYGRLVIRLRPFGLELREVRLVSTGGIDPIPIRLVDLNRFTPGRPLPRHLSLALRDVRMSAVHPAVAPLQDLLEHLGLENLALDLDLNLEQIPNPVNSWRGHVELRIQQAGTLRLALAVDNLNANGILRAIENPVEWWRVLPPIGIRAGVVEFEDEGLVERIVAARARHTGLTPSAARRLVRADIEAAAQRYGILPLGRLLSEFAAAPARIGYYTGNTEPVYMGRLLLSRDVRDGLTALQVAGYRASSPRAMAWVSAAASIPGKPPRL